MKSLLSALFLVPLAALRSQAHHPAPMVMDHEHCPMMSAAQSSHQAGVEKRGDQAMGFSHEKTHHHFVLYEDGGAIQVLADSSTDKESVTAIRAHLAMIRDMFTSGNFNMPMFIHDIVVPGTQNMKRLRSDILYTYQDLPLGGEVLVQSRNDLAVRAVHNFIRFQIKDHHTGDSNMVSQR